RPEPGGPEVVSVLARRPVAVDGQDTAAETVSGFEDFGRDAGRAQQAGRVEPGHSCTDNGDLCRVQRPLLGSALAGSSAARGRDGVTGMGVDGCGAARLAASESRSAASWLVAHQTAS